MDLSPALLWAALWPALAVALLRMGDVTLNVFKTVFVVGERRGLAALTAGAEAAIWLSAAGIVFSDMTPLRFAGFVVGVGSGTALGVQVVQRLRLGMVTVRVYAPVGTGDLVADALHGAGFRATVFEGRGFGGPVQMVLSTVRRRDADGVMALAREVEEQAFIAVDNSLHPAGVGAAYAGRV
ncbi:MAG: DUF5698 domain-containing protein [Actinomycetes bacterium]